MPGTVPGTVPGTLLRPCFNATGNRATALAFAVPLTSLAFTLGLLFYVDSSKNNSCAATFYSYFTNNKRGNRALCSSGKPKANN